MAVSLSDFRLLIFGLPCYHVYGNNYQKENLQELSPQLPPEQPVIVILYPKKAIPSSAVAPLDGKLQVRTSRVHIGAVPDSVSEM